MPKTLDVREVWAIATAQGLVLRAIVNALEPQQRYAAARELGAIVDSRVYADEAPDVQLEIMRMLAVF